MSLLDDAKAKLQAALPDDMDSVDELKAKLGDNIDKVEGAIDTATDKLKEHTPDQVDGLVDKAEAFVKDKLGQGEESS